jgi:hypothetical protein
VIKNAHRFRSSITCPGKLKFFEVDYPVSFWLLSSNDKTSLI